MTSAASGFGFLVKELMSIGRLMAQKRLAEDLIFCFFFIKKKENNQKLGWPLIKKPHLKSNMQRLMFYITDY
jgi:hypothetical protein